MTAAALSALDAAIARRARVKAELMAIAAEPSPFVVRGFQYQSAAQASVVRGKMILAYMNRLDAADAEIERLTDAPHGADDDEWADDWCNEDWP